MQYLFVGVQRARGRGAPAEAAAGGEGGGGRSHGARTPRSQEEGGGVLIPSRGPVVVVRCAGGGRGGTLVGDDRGPRGLTGGASAERGGRRGVPMEAFGFLMSRPTAAAIGFVGVRRAAGAGHAVGRSGKRKGEGPVNGKVARDFVKVARCFFCTVPDLIGGANAACTGTLNGPSPSQLFLTISILPIVSIC